MSNPPRHLAAATLVALTAVGLAACGSPDVPYTPVVDGGHSVTTRTNTPAERQSGSDRSQDAVFGQVRDRFGRPAAGVVVEFKNLLGENGHTTTDGSGRYAMALPADVYTALAFDDDPTGANYAPVSGSRSVSVSGTLRVDFVEA